MTQDNIFSFKQPEDNPGYLLWQVSMSWQLQMKKGLDLVDLTLTQFVLLAALHWLTREGDVVHQNDIATHAGLDKMTTSKVLRTLQTKGFVVRSEDQRDTRAKIIRLTDTGLVALKKANRIVEQTDKAFFGWLAAQESDYIRLMKVLMQAARK